MKHRNLSKFNAIIFGIAFFLLFTVTALYCIDDYCQHRIVLNEIGGNHESIVENGRLDDYVELYNPGRLPCRMDSLYLSDDPDDLQKLSLSGQTIFSGDYLVVALGSGEGQNDAFKIKSSGETIYLSDSRGRILDEAESAGQEFNVAYARNRDGDGEWMLADPTPGSTNENSSARVASPVFSVESGFYDESFELNLRAEPGMAIYYTTDGSVPSAESEKYEKSITVCNVSERENIYNSMQRVVTDWKSYEPDLEPVDKAFLVRAVACDSFGNCSEPAIGIYFVGMDSYQEKNIVSLVADPDDLFGEDGIHVTGKAYDDWYENGQDGEKPVENFNKHGRLFEVEATMQFFQGRMQLEQDVGIRIQGSSNRAGAKKRFTIASRKEYSGEKYFGFEFFPGKKTHTVVLRETFADILCQSLVSDRAVASQRAIPVTVFLNGEYWYDTYLQERYDSHYILNTYGVDKDNVVMISDGFVKEGSEQDHRLYGDMYAFCASHDFSDDEAYEAFSEMVDLQSYIDFMCANIYLCNMDCAETKNYNLWRAKVPGKGTYSDGRFRWMMYDMDNLEWNHFSLKSYKVTKTAAINSFKRTMPTTGISYRKQQLFEALKKNSKFRRKFVLTFMDLANENFSKENVAEKLGEWGEDLSWNDSFFELRPLYIVPYLATEFKLSGTPEQVELSVNDENGGSIRINTITPTLRNKTWRGRYYSKYPVTVSALANPGYRFAGWTGSVTSKEKKIKVSLSDGGARLQAVFEKIGD